LVQEGYDLNVTAHTAANRSGVTALGDGGERTMFSVDAPNVIVETVKPAEDGSEDIIVRLYESMRTATRCTLSTSLPVSKAVETDMLENPSGDLKLDAGQIALEFHPFEIKTVRLSK